MARRTYYTLLTRENSAAPWCIAFGDYDRETVAEEMRDKGEAGEYTRGNMKIIQSGASQAAINTAVSRANAVAIYPSVHTP